MRIIYKFKCQSLLNKMILNKSFLTGVLYDCFKLTDVFLTEWDETCECYSCLKLMIQARSSIVNEVIRGNFTSIKRIKKIKSIKSIRSQASNFLPLRHFYAHSDFFFLDVFYAHSNLLPLRRFMRIVVIFVFVRLFDVLTFLCFLCV